MREVTITGGTGVLGRTLVTLLTGRGARVRVLTRRAEATAEGARIAVGDLRTGAGLDQALAGADTVLHLATNPFRPRPVDVAGTRRLVEAARRSGSPHLVYVSIVGVDRILWPYYQAKLATERIVAESGLGWTIQRSTQFHDLVLLALWYASRPPVAIVPRGMRGQPVDVRDVAARLVELVDQHPTGRVDDLGGPQILTSAELMRTYLDLCRVRKPIVQLPVPGRAARGFRAGHHLTPDHADGIRTFADYLTERVHHDAGRLRVDVPYRPSAGKPGRPARANRPGRNGK